MLTVLRISVPVFAVILLGFVSGRRETLGANAGKTLGQFVFLYAMPAYLFLAMARIKAETVFHWPYVAAFATSIIIVAAIAYTLGAVFFSQRLGERALSIMGSAYINSGHLGIPLTVLAFGDPSPVISIIVLQVVVVSTIILAVLERDSNQHRHKTSSLAHIPKVLLKTPIVSASLLGILFSIAKIELPNMIVVFCELFGQAGIPSALFALGLSFADKHVGLERKQRIEVASMVVLKLIVQPLVAFLVGKYLFQLPPKLLAPLVLIAGMPSAVNTYIYAQSYGVYVERAGAVVLISTVLSTITLTVLMVLLGVGQ